MNDPFCGICRCLTPKEKGSRIGVDTHYREKYQCKKYHAALRLRYGIPLKCDTCMKELANESGFEVPRIKA